MADKAKILKEISEDFARVEKLNQKLNNINSEYQNKRAEAESDYKAKQNENLKTAEDEYRKNAVNYMATKHKLSEDMANKGLENSGLGAHLNQTAYLSADSNNQQIEKKRDTTSAELEEKHQLKQTELENERSAELLSAKEKWEKENQSEAEKVYKAQVSAEKEAAKAAEKAAKAQSSNKTSSSKKKNEEEDEGEEVYIKDPHKKGIISYNGGTLSHDFEGSLSQNGVKVTYNDDGTTTYQDTTTGRTSVFPISSNPFTGDNNAKGNSDTAKAWRKYGYYSNGYQPRGVIYLGADYGKVTPTGILTNINGRNQNIHKTKDGSLWVWDGANNRYIRYKGTLDMSILNK